MTFNEAIYLNTILNSYRIENYKFTTGLVAICAVLLLQIVKSKITAPLTILNASRNRTKTFSMHSSFGSTALTQMFQASTLLLTATSGTCEKKLIENLPH